MPYVAFRLAKLAAVRELVKNCLPHVLQVDQRPLEGSPFSELAGEAGSIAAGSKDSRGFAPALAVALARLHGPRPRRPDLDAELIELTVPELRRLTNALIINPVTDPAPVLAWSNWRRRLQARARRSHYKRRAAIDPDG